MLKLVDIKKDYVTKGVPTVHALRGLTINFRRNEFVAILGASGCGKTTLLNIIGGLDRYTEGDLIIEGKSTKSYKDGDWDTYRNHSIGFVFQSYNLIMHQTLLKNVELALTISGISKEERKQRALAAIKTVGLEGMEKKKPNQLSGGQMQRVAIARALVNNPEILLADEPTGALDSETSIQIMDLLKEVAQDRLVIMVTHNPDLANKYATRIVLMSDGLLTDDSRPYAGETEGELNAALNKKQEIIAAKGNKKQTSMSFFTATGLSFSNLLSKLKRTILIAIAGSIGIIGVSSVLSVSFGVRNYINNMQDDMLSEYPVTISESSISMTSLITGLSSWDQKELAQFDLTTDVGVNSMISYLINKYSDFTSVKTNDINENLISFVEGLPKESVSSLSYDYGLDPTNNIFTEWVRGQGETEEQRNQKHWMSLNGLTQMYIAELRTVDGFSEYAQFVNLFTNFMNQLPGDEEFIMSQYDFVGKNSRFPKAANEMLLVVDDDQTMTDFLFAQLGFFKEDEFINIAQRAVKLQELREKLENDEITKQQFEERKQQLIEKYYYPDKYSFDDILNKKLTYYPHETIWTYKDNVVENVTFVINIPYPKDGGGYENYEITYNLAYSEGEDLLEGTLSCPKILNNRAFDIQLNRNSGVKNDAKPYVGDWLFSLSYAGTTIEMNYVLDDLNNVTAYMYGNPLGASTYTVENLDKSTYYYPADADVTGWASSATEMKIVGIVKKKADVNFGSISRGIYYNKEFSKLVRDGAKNSDIVSHPSHGLKNYIGGIKENNGKAYDAYVEYRYTSYRKGENDPAYEIKGTANAINTSSGLGTLVSFSTSSTFDNDKSALRLIAGLATKYDTSDDGMILGGYVFEDLPQSISIYPKNFAEKKKVTSYLDKWNSDQDITIMSHGVEKSLSPDERDELTYSDTIEMIISVINTLITAITVALVVFTSLSLVVSCFMIAVITYISTMERVKEIGVIRSLGGRKKDVSRLFIAETLIIGLASGVFGILMTYVIQVILNLIVAQYGVFGIAALPIWMAAIMIGLSIFLNVISGLIPSMRASQQDPVVALRTE